MRPTLKIIISILASLLLLAIVTVVTLPFLVDLNDFKAQIEAFVQDNTGRTLNIEGEIELSVFPWLGITTEKMTLNNAEGFSAQPFAEIRQSQIKVKLLPLLFNQVEVSEVVLKGLNLNLLRNSQGLSNWDDLAALIRAKQNQPKSPLKLLEIAGLLIEDAQIVWDDQQAKQNIRIEDFSLNTDKLVFNQPIELTFGFTAHSSEVDLTETVNFAGDLTVTEELDVFNLTQIKLKTKTEGKSVPTGKLVATVFADANFDLKQQTLKLAPLKIKTDALTVTTPVLMTWLEKPFRLEGSIHIPNFDAAEFIQKQLAIKLPQMADEKALTWLAADFHLNADADHLRLQNLEIQLDETTAKGSAQLNNFSDPAITFNFSLDRVNFDRYLPLPESGDDIQNLTPPGSTVAENATLFPVETLKGLNLNGQLTINDLKIKNLTMQGVRLLLNARNGQLQSYQSVNRLYQGAYNSKIVFDVSNELPVLTLTQQLSHIQLEPLLMDLNGQAQLAGLIDIDAKLEAKGNTDYAIKSSLTGRLNFLGKDMLIRGFNLQKVIDNGKILLSSSSLSTENKKDQTAFSKVTGTAIISNGFLINNDLAASAAKTKVGGVGVINLVSQQLDYKIIAILVKEKLTATHAKVVNNLPVFINIGGTFDAPAYQVDLAAMGVGL